VGRSRLERPRLAHLAGEAFLVGAVYYAAAHFSLHLALVEKNVTPLWPPTGIALAAFVLLRRSVWPGVAVAAFLVNLPISPDPLAAAVTAAGNTAAPLVAATLLQWVGFRREIDRVRDATAVVFLAALLSMTVSATVGSLALVVSGTITGGDFWTAWTVWWTGDAMGVMVVAPFLLTLPLHREWIRTSWGRRLEAAALFVFLVAVSLFVTRAKVHLLFVAIPLLGWAAWRFQQRGAAPLALVMAGSAS